jgi:chitin deacetylase
MSIMHKEYRIAIASLLLLIAGGCAKTFVPKTQMLSKAVASEVQPAKVLPPPHAKMTIPTWAQGKVVANVKVKRGVKAVALTFDDGPWPRYTHQILAILKKHNIKATFFMVGSELAKRPQVGRDVVAAGMVVGNHSWDHPAKPRDAISQVKRTDSEIYKDLGIYTHLFRPPYGILKNGMAAQAETEKHAVMLWSVDSEDWKRPPSATIARTVMREVYPGGIILMHDGGGNRSHTVAALKMVIPALKEKGYKFVTVPELMEMRYVAAKKSPSKKTVQK